MTKNAMIVGRATIVAVAVIIVFWLGKDWLQSVAHKIECDDGPRQTIDLRDFILQYSAYSVEFQAAAGNEARFSGKVEPILHQQLTEAFQQAMEFRKFLVAGYNACAVTKAQYALFGTQFQAMDGLARQIDSLTKQPELAAVDRMRLSELVTQYVAIAQKAIPQ